MEVCLLCLHTPKDDNYIHTQSSQWLNFNIPNIVEKHFWPMGNFENFLGICESCWKQLFDFHNFYINVSSAHNRNIEIALQLQQTPENYNEMLIEYQENMIDRKPTIECYIEKETIQEQNISETYPLIAVDLTSNELDVFEEIKWGIKSEINDEVISKEKTCMNFIDTEGTLNKTPNNTTVMMCNERDYNPMSTINVRINGGIQRHEDNFYIQNPKSVEKPKKRKPGRPPKERTLKKMIFKKPMAKRGRPRKVVIENTSLELLINNSPNSHIKSGKRGRPRKKLMMDEIKKNFSKKRKRGRPRKVCINDTLDYTNLVDASHSSNKTQISAQDSIAYSTLNFNRDIEPCFEMTNRNEAEGILILEKENISKELTYEKPMSNRMKRHIRFQQHKTIMRNYIATSVRCKN